MIDFGSINTDVFPPAFTESNNTSSNSSTKSRFQPDNTDNNNTEPEKPKSPGATNTEDLDSEEIRELTELKQRDREVRAHEQAHIAAGGAYVKSGAQYEYEKGPDGKRYAVGGEVQIDTSKVPGDPEATLRKMQAIRGAAMAPANPSGQDRRVASKATQMENKTRLEILTLRYEEAAALRSDASEKTGDSGTSDIKDGRPSLSLGGLIDISG